MAHLSTSIEGLLNQNTSFLGRLFDMDGKEARLQLLELKEKGDKYVPSDKCTNFDPKIGCRCDKGGHKGEKGTFISVIRSESKKIE